MIRVYVWDIFTRVFHWLLAFTVIAGLLLGKTLDFSTIQLHFYLGYATGLLIILRIIWGFIGPSPIRWKILFSSISHSKIYIRSLLKRRPSGIAGHNPLGGLSVIAIMFALTAQVLTGLFAESDGLFHAGPLSFLANQTIITYANFVHYIVGNMIIALAIIHILAVIFYLVWKKENLIIPMITGFKFIRNNRKNCEKSIEK